MSEASVVRRPVLAAHTRYRWDKLRDQHQLVFPEGMIVLNDSAAAIVQLCDGRSTDELIAALVAKLKDSDPGLRAVGRRAGLPAAPGRKGTAP